MYAFSLAFVPAAVETCKVNHNTSLCSVPLGGTVYIQMMTNATNHQLWCKKLPPFGSTNVFTLRRGKLTIQDEYKNRTEFFISNGTLKLTHMERNDSGQYSVEVFDPNGVHMRDINLTLDVRGKCLKLNHTSQLIHA